MPITFHNVKYGGWLIYCYEINHVAHLLVLFKSVCSFLHQMKQMENNWKTHKINQLQNCSLSLSVLYLEGVGDRLHVCFQGPRVSKVSNCEIDEQMTDTMMKTCMDLSECLSNAV